MWRDVLGSLVKRGAGALDAVRPTEAGVVVLIYHRVGATTGVAVDLPTSLFDEQIAWLVTNTTVLTLNDAVAVLLGRALMPQRPVVITFDDGTADFATHAVPVLERHRAPATLYVATDFIDRGRPFPDDGTPLSWHALADCVATGLVDVGSHSHRHVLFDRLEPSDIDDELDRSIGLIGERLGVEAKHFAYPKALLGSAAAEHAIRRRFVSAAIAGTRANVPLATDLHRLHRSPLQVSDGMQWFERKVGGGMAVEDALRRLLNRRRYQGATT